MPATATRQVRLPKLHAGQERVEEEANRFNVLACGRRWGKTTFGLIKACEPALQGNPVGWFVPSFKYVQEVWRELTQRLRTVTTKANAQERRLELVTGGVIEVWSYSGDDAPGQSRAYKRVVVDEGGLIAESHSDFIQLAWQEGLRPTLSDYEGDAWFIGTPKGRGNEYHTLFEWGQEREHWASWQMPTWTNPHIPDSEIEAMERDMHQRRYAQEVKAEFLAAVEGALWDWDMLDRTRADSHPELTEIVVGVDPAGGGGDEIGIVTAGKGTDGHAYVLSDDTMTGRPGEWARAVKAAYERHNADKIVAEKNFGGSMVKSTLQNVGERLPVKVISASRGKQQRAQPVSYLWDEGDAHIVGTHEELENQLTTWTTDSSVSPDRLDALVWALTELMLQETSKTPGIVM